MRVRELHFLDHGFDGEVLAEIEHRERMVRDCRGARQSQRRGDAKRGYNFHFRSP